MEKEPLSSSKKEGPSHFLAGNLRRLRQAKGISQQELAESVGLKRSNIASYESGIVEPRPERFLALARFFKIDPSILLIQDLSALEPDHPLFRGESGEFERVDRLLQQLTGKTNDLEKVLEGFRAFHELKNARSTSTDSATTALRHDMENLMHILENLLETNRTFIQSFPQERT